MDEVDRLETELLAVMKELLEKDPDAVLRVLLCLQQAGLPTCWPKLQMVG